MQFRILSIEDAAPGERTPALGRYTVVIEVDSVPHRLLYTVELPQGGGRSVQWEPARSILSDPAVPIMVVGAITDAVVRYHSEETCPLPLEVLPREPGPGTIVIHL